jgi:hypothetical protein
MGTVSFNAFGPAVIKAMKAQEAAAIKSGQVIDDTFRQYLDACTIAGVPRTQEGVDAIGDEILECQVMLDAIAIYGPVFKNTITSYSGGAKRAYYWGEQWYASAHLAPVKGGLPFLPWGKGAKAEAARLAKLAAGDGEAPAKKTKAGTVERTNDKALLDTIRKAIEQAVILNRFEFKGGLIDLACTIDPDFKV